MEFSLGPERKLKDVAGMLRDVQGMLRDVVEGMLRVVENSWELETAGMLMCSRMI